MLYLIIPCYNEQEVLLDTTARLLDFLPNVPVPTRILYVDDGSADGTWEMICRLSAEHSSVYGLRLSHNVGQQTATWAGMDVSVAQAEALICLDADLQDDIHVLPAMVKKYQEGCDVVYGVRSDRSTDSIFKRYPAGLFYKLMTLLGCDLVENHSEFRLLSQRAAQALLSYPERNLFVRCMVPMLGFKTDQVYYSRQARTAGRTKYSTIKLVRLALDGITNFSVRPIRWIQIMGCLCIVVSLGVIAWALVNYAMGRTALGWPSLLISLWFLSGAMLVAIGIIGEYIGKIYTEVKRRPRYFIMDKTLNMK